MVSRLARQQPLAHWAKRYGPAFLDLTESDRTTLRQAVYQAWCLRGEPLWTGQTEAGFVAVMSGAIRVFRLTRDGKRVPLCHRRSTGTIFSLPRPYHYGASPSVAEGAGDETHVYYVTWPEIQQISGSNPRVAAGSRG